MSSLDASARATWSTSGLGAGTHALYALYAGGTNFAANTSPVILELVIAPRSVAPAPSRARLLPARPAHLRRRPRLSRYLLSPRAPGRHPTAPRLRMITARLSVARRWHCERPGPAYGPSTAMPFPNRAVTPARTLRGRAKSVLRGADLVPESSWPGARRYWPAWASWRALASPAWPAPGSLSRARAAGVPWLFLSVRQRT